MKTKTRTNLSQRFLAFLLCVLMCISIVPLDAFAFDYGSSNIEVKPTTGLVREGGGNLNIKYDSPHWGNGNGSYYDIIMKSNTNGYRSIGFCLNKGLKLDAATWNDPKEASTVNNPNIAAVLGEVKPYLDFFFYATETAKGRAEIQWNWEKCEAFTRAVQSIIWLNLESGFVDKSEADKQLAYAREMEAAIARLNQGKNLGDAGYISNGTQKYDLEACKSSLAYMAGGWQSHENGPDIPLNAFEYYVVTPSKTGNQHVLVPYYLPPVTDADVYVQFQKVASDTNLPLPGCVFDVYVNGRKDSALTYTTTSATIQTIGPIILKNGDTSANISIYETRPAAGYRGSASGSVIATTADNGTAATAAVISATPLINTLPDIPPSDTPLVKIDAATGMPLAGAVFSFVGTGEYYNGTGMQNSPYNGTFTTGSDGAPTVQIQWKDPNAANFIAPGSYTVTETHAPTGYDLSGPSQTITLMAEWVWNTPSHGVGSTHDLGDGSTCTQAPLGVDSNNCGAYHYTSSGTLTFENNRHKSIELIKMSESGATLAGAQFDVYRDLTYLGNYPTDANGTLRIDNLVTGTYMFVETKAPVGYILPQNPVSYIYVDTSDTTIDLYSLVAINYDVPDILIVKQDSLDGSYLSGAKFDVFIQEQKIGTYETSGGVILVPRADYIHLLNDVDSSWIVKATEVSPPENYFAPVTAERTKSIKMERGSNMLSLVFENDPYFGLEIAKFIDGTNTFIDGAKFDVFINGNLFKSGVSGDSGTGMFNISKEELGAHLATLGNTSWTIMVRETDAPAGHLLSTPNEFTQTVFMGRSEPVYFVFGNPPTVPFEIYKTNDSNQPLEGATFEIYIDNTLSFTRTTDATGYIRITPEEFGKYLGSGENKESWIITATEIAAPSGYMLPLVEYRSQSQTIVKGQHSVAFSFVNTKYPEIRLLKEDADTCEPLDNALFQLDIDGKQFGTFITDLNGEIVIGYHDQVRNGVTIPGYGRFLDDLDEPNKNEWLITFTELQAPGNYLMPIDKSQSNILVIGQELSTFSFYNSIYPEIYLSKTDGTTGEQLPGAHFDVDIEGYRFGSFVTDENGKIIIRFNDTLDDDGNVVVSE